jgi:hypothetical protein
VCDLITLHPEVTVVVHTFQPNHVHLLSLPTGNLAYCHEANRVLIVNAGAIPPLVWLLRRSPDEATRAPAADGLRTRASDTTHRDIIKTEDAKYANDEGFNGLTAWFW